MGRTMLKSRAAFAQFAVLAATGLLFRVPRPVGVYTEGTSQPFYGAVIQPQAAPTLLPLAPQQAALGAQGPPGSARGADCWAAIMSSSPCTMSTTLLQFRPCATSA